MRYTAPDMRIRFLIAVLMIAWLPLQGWAAVAMPFCQHGHDHGDATSARSADHGHGAQADDAGPTGHLRDAHTASGKAPGALCSDCGPCHLACASSLASTQISVPLAPMARIYPQVAHRSLVLFYPEQPNPPPLTAIA